jgi:hypothetical protein
MRMPHKLHRIVSFERVGNYRLQIVFADGGEQTIDFEPILFGEMFGLLRDLSFFNQVQLDPIAHTLVWSNGADSDPETLRHWPDYVQELSTRARQWDATAVNPTR